MTPFTDVPEAPESAVMVGINVDPSAEISANQLEVKVASITNGNLNSITMSADLALFVAKQITEAALFIMNQIDNEDDDEPIEPGSTQPA